MNTYRSKRKNGFSLLGVILATTVALLVVGTVASISARVYGTMRTSKERFIASGLAREGIELVRSLRDNNWFYYPQPGDPLPVTQIKWRGCASGESCPGLKKICDGTYIIDPYDANPELKSGNEKLYLTSDNKFTHATTGTASIFSRSVTIDTVSDDSKLTTGGSITYMPDSGGCGEIVDSTPTNISFQRPRPFIVRSTVTWKDPTSGQTKTLTLEEMLYDWMYQRP